MSINQDNEHLSLRAAAMIQVQHHTPTACLKYTATMTPDQFQERYLVSQERVRSILVRWHGALRQDDDPPGCDMMVQDIVRRSIDAGLCEDWADDWVAHDLPRDFDLAHISLCSPAGQLIVQCVIYACSLAVVQTVPEAIGIMLKALFGVNVRTERVQ